MGYSFTAKAGYTLDAIATMIGANTSNGMPDGGFYETGREQVDGAITGTVWKPCASCGTIQNVPCHVTRRGSFRINPDGTVKRFPGLARKLLNRAEQTGAARYVEIHCQDYNWRLAALTLAEFLKTEQAFEKECWQELQTITAAYQRETKAMFLAMPPLEHVAMAAFLESIATR